MKEIFSVRTMAEVAIFAALGYVLDALAGVYSSSVFVNGGSIGIAMMCVFIVSYRRGILPGILTGLIMGLLDLADGFYAIAGIWYLAFAQVLLDYVICYPLAGFAGLFRKAFRKADSSDKKIMWIVIGCLVGGSLKFASHYLSGILFWNDPSGFIWNFTDGYLYSFIYNMAYMLPCIVLCTGLMVLIEVKWPSILEDVSSFSFGKGRTSRKENKLENKKEGE